MKIKCSYCDCSIDVTADKCPYCGGANEQAVKYLKEKEAEARKDKDREFEAREKNKEREYTERKHDKRRKTIVGLFIFLVLLSVGVIGNIQETQQKKEERLKIEQQRIEEEAEAKLRAEEEAKEKEEYDSIVVEAKGLNSAVEKDRYFSVEITEIVPYELYYDHQTDAPFLPILLSDTEHRVAVQVKLKNYQEYMNIYGKPTEKTGLYVTDENDVSVYMSNDDKLNGSGEKGENYYGYGGNKLSGKEFINNYFDIINKNQTITWWIPLVVTEDTEKLIFHFDYNMSIEIDNPCTK